jgi:hypothetical protein
MPNGAARATMPDVAALPDAPLRLPAAAASLRIYEPVEAFPADRRSALLAAAHNGEGASSVASAERAAGLRAAAALPPRLTDDIDLQGARQRGARAPLAGDSETAWFLLNPPGDDGRPRLSPAQLRWRSLIALEDFRRGIPESMLHIFVPDDVHGSAARELAQVEHRAIHTRPHSMVSPWHIPLAWLCVFAARDRLQERPGEPAETVDAADADDRGRSSRPMPALAAGLRYRASMSDGRRTLARALGTVRKTQVEWLSASDLEGVGRWLEEFHPRSVIELDYGTLRPSGASAADAVPGDTSVEEMAAAMDELKSGRADSASRIVEGVTSRWDAVRTLEHAS